MLAGQKINVSQRRISSSPDIGDKIVNLLLLLRSRIFVDTRAVQVAVSVQPLVAGVEGAQEVSAAWAEGLVLQAGREVLVRNEVQNGAAQPGKGEHVLVVGDLGSCAGMHGWDNSEY